MCNCNRALGPTIAATATAVRTPESIGISTANLDFQNKINDTWRDLATLWNLKTLGLSDGPRREPCAVCGIKYSLMHDVGEEEWWCEGCIVSEVAELERQLDPFISGIASTVSDLEQAGLL